MDIHPKTALAQHFDAYKASVRNEALLQFASIIRPYLDEHRISMHPVWNDFWMEKDNHPYYLREDDVTTHIIDLLSDDKEALEVLRILLTPVPGMPGHSLAHFMPKYIPKGKAWLHPVKKDVANE